MKPLHIIGMHGHGDCIHQRAVVKELRKRHEVWLETPWPDLYWDMPDVRLVSKGSRLRTQAKNAERRASQFQPKVPRGAPAKKVWYTPQDVRRAGSVLGAMSRSCGVPVGDFRLPIKPDWDVEAQRLLRDWRPTKPLMIYRPLVERTEWGGCAARNPDFQAYDVLFRAVRDDFFVVSVADLEPGKEWVVSRPVGADVELHSGEVPMEVLAALVRRSSLAFASPGFAVILAQAVGTPSLCVFGGYESSSSFSAGARFTPYLGIDPINPCSCFSHNHECNKRIDIPAAIIRTKAFVAAHCQGVGANRPEVLRPERLADEIHEPG